MINIVRHPLSVIDFSQFKEKEAFTLHHKDISQYSFISFSLCSESTTSMRQVWRSSHHRRSSNRTGKDRKFLSIPISRRDRVSWYFEYVTCSDWCSSDCESAWRWSDSNRSDCVSYKIFECWYPRYTEKCYNDHFAFKHSSTFAGNTLACRVGMWCAWLTLAGLKVLDLVSKDEFALVHHVHKLGDALMKSLLDLQKKFPLLIKEVRGKGFLIGIEFTFPRTYQPNHFFLLGVMAEQELLVIGAAMNNSDCEAKQLKIPFGIFNCFCFTIAIVHVLLGWYDIVVLVECT